MPRDPFDALVERHAAQVVRICRAILRDEHLGADAAQEAYLRLWRRWHRGEQPEQTGAWLRTAAVSAALDVQRRRAVRTRAEDAARPELPVLTIGGPASDARASELNAALEAAIAELPEGQRTVFLLRHEGGLALREVAETLGLVLPTVKTHFARACLKLQRRLSAHRPDTGGSP